MANVYSEGVEVADYWVSEKLDGVRALWDGKEFITRRGNRIAAPPWFLEGLPDVVLDGELWIGRGTFDELSGAVRRHKPDGDAWRKIRFMVFDLPEHPDTFNERLRHLRVLFDAFEPPFATLVEQYRVASHEELMNLLGNVVGAGGEGLMLRRAKSRYRPGRSDDLLKLKPHEDAEALVVAHLPGRGKYQGLLGSLLVETPDGRRFKLGTGFSDAERRNPPAIGSRVTYRYRGKTGGGLPRFASFLRVREEF